MRDPARTEASSTAVTMLSRKKFDRSSLDAGPESAYAAPVGSRAKRAPWNMAGYQVDFDFENEYTGQMYEQSCRVASLRGVASLLPRKRQKTNPARYTRQLR